jgi:hypothetical protein
MPRALPSLAIPSLAAALGLLLACSRGRPALPDAGSGACAADASDASPAFRQFCKDMVATRLARVAECLGGAKDALPSYYPYLDSESVCSCLDVRISSALVCYHPERAEECIQFLASASCSVITSLLQSDPPGALPGVSRYTPCALAIAGLADAGTVCANDVDCGPQALCGRFNGVCIPDEGGSCFGTTVCPPGQICQGPIRPSQSCLPPSGPGGNCGLTTATLPPQSWQCDWGLHCRDGGTDPNGDPVLGHCEAQTADGACDAGEQCLPGSSCVGGRCVKSKHVGEACVPGECERFAECNGGVCTIVPCTSCPGGACAVP